MQFLDKNTIDKNITVAVYMITYNHERYIEQAIESVMMQQTSFLYKLFVGEDCSTDKTKSICENLKKKYPNKIALYLNEKNIGASANAFQIYRACFESGAKYVAMLEGDDYWTDSMKLQQQVDFLECNLAYSICGHPVQVINSLGDELYIRPDSIPKEMNHINLLKENFLTTCSVVFKNFSLTDSQKELLSKIKFGDWPLFLFCAEKGKIGFLDTLSAIYRKHSEGTWSTSNSIKQQMAILDFYKQYNSYTHGKFLNVISEAKISVLRKLTLECLKQRKIIYSFYFYLRWAFSDKKKMYDVSKFYLGKLKSTYLLQ